MLPKHWWEGRDFESTTLDPPLGSGPYRIAAVEPGRSITLERVPDYWGRDLPVNRGQNNIGVIRYDYYRDATVAVEAFKAGEFDFRNENNSKEWGTAYDLPDVESGRMIKELIDHERPDRHAGVLVQHEKGEVRRPPGAPCAGPRLRLRVEQRAPVLRPVHAHEELLLQYRARLFGASGGTGARDTGALARPAPRGGVHEGLRAPVHRRVRQHPAQPANRDRRCCSEAGWVVRDGTLTHAGTGEAMEIEFLLVAPAFERIVGPVVKNMERLGIAARIRLVDPAQYQNRINEFDFDIVVSTRGQSLSPGNEQRNYWTTDSAGVPGSGNLAGHQGSRRRRAGRPPDPGAESRHPGGHDAGPGPRAAVGPLRDSAVAHPKLQARVLEPVRPARHPAEVRARIPGDLVDRRGEGRQTRSHPLDVPGRRRRED